MKTTNKEIVAGCMARVEESQRHISAVEAAVNFVLSRNHQMIIDSEHLRAALLNEECKAWRDLFMWGMTLEQDVIDRIKAAAHQRHLRNDMEIARWLNNGVMPRSWLSADEEEFREMARVAFAPKQREEE